MTQQPVLTLRPAAERGFANHGWLKSAHSFSFGGYHDPEHFQYRSLRVINDDEVAGSGGFPSHPHQDAEIFSYVLEGALAHEDSLGNGSTVAAGGVQYMSAGSGVVHSEFNPSASDRVRFLQVWLLPDEAGTEPRYETRQVTEDEKRGKLALFLSPDGRDGSMQVRAGANVYAGLINGTESIEHDLGDHQHAWLQVAAGSLTLNGEPLVQGDGVAIEGGGLVQLEHGVNAEVLMFELD